MATNRFKAIVHLDKKGEILCFCPYAEYLKGLCVCREEYDCPEAIIEITPLPNSRPSEQDASLIKKINKDNKKTVKELKKATDRIKQGVKNLERASRSTKWRI